MKFKIIGIIIFSGIGLISVLFISQMKYMMDIEKKAETSYAQSEIDRINTENESEETILDFALLGTSVTDDDKLTDEEKDAYDEEYFINEEHIDGTFDINDYMLEMTDEEYERCKYLINERLEAGLISDAVNEASNILKTYNLNERNEFKEYLENVEKLYFLINNSGYTTVGIAHEMADITDISVYIYAFTRIDKYSQCEIIKFKDSEILPTSDECKIISIDSCSPRTEMNAGILMGSLKNLDGYKAIVELNNQEYAMYILKNKVSGSITLYKTLLVDVAANSISTNSYSVYENIIIDEEDKTYGTPVKKEDTENIDE